MNKRKHKAQILAIAKRLKKARIANHFKSGRYFALLMDVHQTTYWQHENGIREMTLIQAQKYCEWLRLDLHYLATGEIKDV